MVSKDFHRSNWHRYYLDREYLGIHNPGNGKLLLPLDISILIKILVCVVLWRFCPLFDYQVYTRLGGTENMRPASTKFAVKPLVHVSCFLNPLDTSWSVSLLRAYFICVLYSFESPCYVRPGSTLSQSSRTIQ